MLHNHLWTHFAHRSYDIGSPITRYTFDLDADLSHGFQINLQIA